MEQEVPQPEGVEAVVGPSAVDAGPEVAPDYGEWLGSAGLDPKELPDPGQVAQALAFHHQWSDKGDIYTKDQVQTQANELLRQQFQDPATHTRLKDYFRKELEGEFRSQTLGADAEPDALGSFRNELSQRVGPIENALAQLLEQQKTAQKQTQDQAWEKTFTAAVADAVRRGNNGVLEGKTLESELRRRYASGEVKDDSPATLLSAVKGLITEKLAERDAWAEQNGVASLLNQNRLQVPPNMKINDVVGDEDQMNSLLEHIINNGMPPGD